MANPTNPKDAKPKSESDDFDIKQGAKAGNQGGGSSVATILGVVFIAAIVTIIANYFLVDSKVAQLSKKIDTISAGEEEETAEDGESVAAERGIILDLGEFILNLSNPNAKKFLKVNVAIELSKKESDIEAEEAAKASSGGHGGGGASPMEAIEAEMNQYKPAIRDSVISVLTSKTSDELSTTPGKELAKEQIKEAIDAIFEGEREVLRVSFGSFFIQ